MCEESQSEWRSLVVHDRSRGLMVVLSERCAR